MSNYLLILSTLLFGQVTETGADRYDNYTPNTAPTFEATTETEDTPAEEQTPPTNDPPAGHPPTGLTKVIKPAELIETLTKTIVGETLEGTRTSLTDVVLTAQNRAEQTKRVNLYWMLSQATMQHRLAGLELLELQTLQNGIAQPSREWELARQAAASRQETAQAAVKSIQLRLHEELGLRSTDALALPADLPHSGAYETKYDQLFHNRNSEEARQLSELIPLVHLQLATSAADVSAAHQWLLAVSQQRSPQSDGTHLLKAYEQLALQRRAFIALTYQYNAQIARYTELAVPQKVGATRLAAMLIQKPAGTSRDWQRSGVQRASAEEPLDTDGTRSNRPRTFAEPGESDTWRADASASSGERSIVVPKGSGKR